MTGGQKRPRGIVSPRAWALSVVALSLVAIPSGALACSASASSAKVAAERSKPGQAKAVAFERGVTLGDFGPTAYPQATIAESMRKLKRNEGARWVTLLVIWMQKDQTSTQIAPGGETVPTENLEAAIKAAHKAGLKVILRPYVDRVDGGWRGYINPSSIDDWFASYRNFIGEFASLAQRLKVEGFIVGSELNEIQGYDAQWKRVIRLARSRYKGLLTYQANWDAYRSINWWGKLDLIDISAYFSVGSSTNYTVQDLVRGWHQREWAGGTRSWFDEIDALHRQVGLPVIFGEIGYRTVVGSAVLPFDVDIDAPYSASAQRIAYEAAMRVWYRVPWFKGFQWWYVPARNLTGRGTDHAPAAPAQKVLRRWYHKKR